MFLRAGFALGLFMRDVIKTWKSGTLSSPGMSQDRGFYYFGAKVSEVQNSSEIYFLGVAFDSSPSQSLCLSLLGLLDQPPLLFVLHFRQKNDQCKAEANKKKNRFIANPFLLSLSVRICGKYKVLVFH